jgi:PncC family amidohydrolase
MIQDAASSLVELLISADATCAAAESCTGGGVGAAITSVPGASAVFAGAVVSYSNDVKSNVLGVKPETLASFGAVSSETAKEMAEGVRSLLKTDYAVSVTGIAGPGGGSAEKPVGLVWFALSSRNGTMSVKKVFDGDRNAVRNAAVETAISLLSDSVRRR